MQAGYSSRMTGDQRQHRSRYNVSGNAEAEFVDAEQLVLVNKLGLRELAALQVAEERALARAYASLLSEIRLNAPLSADLIRQVHARIFGDIYAWAGRWRTVWISKPGVTWPPPDYLDQAMFQFERDVLKRWSLAELGNKNVFCRAAAEIQGEFLVIHPFREGNARTIKLTTDVLALQTGGEILTYDLSTEGQAAYIRAAQAAFKRNYAPLEIIIRAALPTAQPE